MAVILNKIMAFALSVALIIAGDGLLEGLWINVSGKQTMDKYDKIELIRGYIGIALVTVCYSLISAHDICVPLFCISW